MYKSVHKEKTKLLKSSVKFLEMYSLHSYSFHMVLKTFLPFKQFK